MSIYQVNENLKFNKSMEFDEINRWVSLSLAQSTYKWSLRTQNAIYDYNSHAIVYMYKGVSAEDDIVE
jgi:hypothetical protein